MFMDYFKKVFGISALEAEIVSLKAQVEDLKAPKNKLRLVSPDGVRTIELVADDHAAGMWISSSKNSPQVAIYNSKYEGAVVGIWGKADKDGKRRGGLDVALSHNGVDGGNVQLLDNKNNAYFISPASKFMGEGTPLNTSGISF